MPTEAVLTRLASRKETESLMMQIILHCAPVIKNVKMSCMFAVPSAYRSMVISVFRHTKMKVRCLCQGAGRALMYVYRPEQTQACLSEPDVISFLRTYGYPEGDAEACLDHLSERIAFFYNSPQTYPHEMGIFLGYPLEDVRGFILHEGKESSYTGYWKVYSDVEKAKRTFRLFDEAKEQSVLEFMSGKRVAEIAC